MKREDLKDIKPIKTIQKAIEHKGCIIGYTVCDYGKGSSGGAIIIIPKN